MDCLWRNHRYFTRDPQRPGTHPASGPRPTHILFQIACNVCVCVSESLQISAHPPKIGENPAGYSCGQTVSYKFNPHEDLTKNTPFACVKSSLAHFWGATFHWSGLEKPPLSHLASSPKQTNPGELRNGTGTSWHCEERSLLAFCWPSIRFFWRCPKLGTRCPRCSMSWYHNIYIYMYTYLLIYLFMYIYIIIYIYILYY